jgi:hypothetical protein
MMSGLDAQRTENAVHFVATLSTYTWRNPSFIVHAFLKVKYTKEINLLITEILSICSTVHQTKSYTILMKTTKYV